MKQRRNLETFDEIDKYFWNFFLPKGSKSMFCSFLSSSQVPVSLLPYNSTSTPKMDISVFFTSELTSSERRISPQWTVGYLKKRIEQITGILPEFQVLQYHPHNSSNEYIVLETADDESVTVADLNIHALSRIHVQDTNPDSALSELANNKEHEGFKLSDEAYEKRSDSVLQWKKNQQLGRFDPEYEKKARQVEAENAVLAQAISVGDRCRTINIGGERRGQVKFVGKIPSLDEGKKVWVGIEFDEPVGKNNGIVDGIRYFNAKPGHGSFVLPNRIEVGDYPEEDLFNSDDEEL